MQIPRRRRLENVYEQRLLTLHVIRVLNLLNQWLVIGVHIGRHHWFSVLGTGTMEAYSPANFYLVSVSTLENVCNGRLA